MRPLVLVAEPDPFALGLLEEACSAEGCEVVAAVDGAQALDFIAREPPAVVIAACDLGEVSGQELLAILRRDPELAGLAVVLAGDGASAEVPDATLQRPYHVTEVQDCVRELLAARLERRRRVREKSNARRVGTLPQWKIALEHEVARALRHRLPLGCVLVRSDQPSVDARALAELLRVVDEVFVLDEGRIGVLLPDTPGPALATVCRRIESTLPGAFIVSGAVPDEARAAPSLEQLVSDRLEAA